MATGIIDVLDAEFLTGAREKESLKQFCTTSRLQPLAPRPLSLSLPEGFPQPKSFNLSTLEPEQNNIT